MASSEMTSADTSPPMTATAWAIESLKSPALYVLQAVSARQSAIRIARSTRRTYRPSRTTAIAPPNRFFMAFLQSLRLLRHCGRNVKPRWAPHFLSTSPTYSGLLAYMTPTGICSASELRTVNVAVATKRDSFTRAEDPVDWLGTFSYDAERSS